MEEILIKSQNSPETLTQRDIRQCGNNIFCREKALRVEVLAHDTDSKVNGSLEEGAECELVSAWGCLCQIKSFENSFQITAKCAPKGSH